MIHEIRQKIRYLLGRGRFRRFERRIHPDTWGRHDELFQWGETCAVMSEELEGPAAYAACDDPVALKGRELRQRVLEEFRDRYAGRDDLRILIHAPSSKKSAGGFSLFSNMSEGFRYLGIPVLMLAWDEPIAPCLDSFAPTVFMTSDDQSYLSKIDWQAVRDYRRGAGMLLGLTASIEAYGNTPLPQRLSWAGSHDVDFFYTFHAPRYCRERADYQPFFTAGYEILSMEFAANPLCYYPVPGIPKDLDYVFLASSNFDKWERYFLFLEDILREHPGFIDGPGWSAVEHWLPRHLHRYLYARGKVGLNLHIAASIDWPSELNERTYILAACGVPQVVDGALLLPERFSADSLFVAGTPAEYRTQFETALHEPAEAQRRALNALEDVFARHTSFHRADAFARELLRLSGNGVIRDIF